MYKSDRRTVLSLWVSCLCHPVRGCGRALAGGGEPRVRFCELRSLGAERHLSGTGTVLRQPLSSFRPQPARGGCPRRWGHLSTPMARPAGPLLTQPLVAFIATGEPPFWFHPELCCLCSSSLSPALSLGTGEAEANNRYKS